MCSRDLLKILVVSSMLAFSACNEETFRSQPKPLVAGSETYSGTCLNGATSSMVAPQNIEGIAGEKAIVNGEFCSLQLKQTVSKPITVLFIIDFSGSMRHADPSSILSGCQRMAAVRSVVDKVMPPNLVASNGQRPQAQFGAISFSDDSQVRVPLTNVDTFRRNLNTSNFCGQTGYTNYQSAFMRAQNMLANVQGDKVVYFISDGFPQTSPSDREQAKAAGLQAANTLRGLPQLRMNIVFLQTDPSRVDPNSTPVNPQEAKAYLDQVAGNPNNVLIASNAANLVERVTFFETPLPKTTIQKADVSAQLTAPGFSPRNITLTVDESDSANGRYRFRTEEFELFYGEIGQVVSNVLRVTAQSSRGPRESIATINLRRTQ